METQHKDIALEWGKTKTLIFTNKAKPKLRIQKIDVKTGELLKNSEFRVEKLEDKTVSEYILENGEITLENLDEAIYRATEFMAPDGYIMLTESKKIMTEWGKTKTLKFDNIRKPVVRFKKTNGLTGKGIAGATFKVERELPNGSTKVIGNFTTNAQGLIVLPKAEAGYYIFSEIKPAPGFSLNKTPIRQYFDAGDNAYLPEYDSYYKNVSTGKYASGYTPNDGTTNNNNSNNNILENNTNTNNNSNNSSGTNKVSIHSGSEYYIEGEGFNFPLNSIVIKKANAVTGELLDGAAFEIYRADEQVSGQPGTQIARVVTDKSGVVVVVGLEPGYYIVKEVQAPKYYVLAETSLQNGFLKPDGTSILEFTFRNFPYGNILIKKVDSVTKSPMAGVKFKVTNGAGELIGNQHTYTTDSNGEILISNVEPDSYVITEIETLPNYIIDNEPKTIQVGIDGKTYTVEFKNNPYGSLVITKVDSITRKPLGGVKFKVTTSDGTVAGNSNGVFTTNANGEIIVPNLAPNSYVVTEIETIAGYQINTTPKTVVINADQETYKVEFENQPFGTLVIKKLDSDTKEPLKNAEFKVTTSKGDVVGNSNGHFTTDEKGTIIIPNLPKNNYIIKEIKAPENYVLENETTSIDIEWGKTHTVEFFNGKMSSAQIVKIDGKTKQPLKDAKFNVYKANNELIGTYVTDGNGVIILPHLEPGWYKAVEVKAPIGYLIDETPQDFEITNNQFLKLVFENQPMSSLIIKKFDKANNKPLIGAKFKITKKSGDIVGEFTTDSNGIIQLDNLAPGWYSAVEVKAPDGYKLIGQVQDFEVNHTKTITLEFPNEKLTSLIIKKTDDKSGQPLSGASFVVEKQNGEHVGDFSTDKDGTINIPALSPDWYVIREKKAPDGYLLDETPKTVEIKTQVPTTVTFTNKKLTALQIKKIDETTGKALSGAVFEISKQNGETIQTNENGTDFVTDGNGFINVPTLKPGFYIVKEKKAPEGYILDQTPKTVEVKTDSPTVVTFTNKYKSGIQIIKVDLDTNEPLPGATFTVYKKSGDIIGEFVTDANGVIILDQLENNWYKIAETKAPEGYQISEEPKDIEVKGNDFHKIVFKNKKLSGLILKKVDCFTNKMLEGAKFEVTKINGEKIGEYITDKSGIAIVPELPADVYIVKEIFAPTGYILDSIPRTIEIKANGKSIELVFENKPFTGIQIKKINSETRAPIEGVMFTLTHMNGEKIGDFKTDKQGMIFINDLEAGTYVLTETKSAEGYLIDSEPKHIEVKNDGKQNIIEVENKPASGLLIVKTDSKTGRPLKGVVFDIRCADGQRVQGNILDQNMPNTPNNTPNKNVTPNGDISGSYVTDNNGRIQINHLVPGEYHVVETKALDGYVLDTDIHAVTITPGKLATLKLSNIPKAGIRIKKIDSVTKKGIFGVEFRVYDFETKKEVAGPFFSDNNGEIDFSGILPAGKYLIMETREAQGYLRDQTPRTIEFKEGQVLEIVWENSPQMGQIQIMKKSASDNEVNGLPKGTPLAGAVFEVRHYKTGNLVDRFESGQNGMAVSNPLPIGRYKINEVVAPKYYKISNQELDIEIEFSSQIVKLEFTNEPANIGVEIKKVGPTEVIGGQPVRYDIKYVKNSSTVPLSSFYWREIIPADALRIDKLVTGTYNQSLRFKIMYKTNKNEYRVAADNLSATSNHVVDLSPQSLGLVNGEIVTEIMLVFGNVKAGFCQVEQPQIFATVIKGLPNGHKFSNKVDVGGKHGEEWVIGNSTWLTTVFSKTTDKLPRTGY